MVVDGQLPDGERRLVVSSQLQLCHAVLTEIAEEHVDPAVVHVDLVSDVLPNGSMGC